MNQSLFAQTGKALHSAFKRLQSIEHDEPELTPEGWFDAQPTARIHIGSKTVIVSQPSSTFLVYLLGVLTIAVGLYFLQVRGNEISRLMWGISLALWGIGQKSLFVSTIQYDISRLPWSDPVAE